MEYMIETTLYKLEDGTYLYIDSEFGDDECNYQYYYFDSDKNLIDGGVYASDSDDAEEILYEIIEMISAEEEYEIINDNISLDDLHNEGFMGF